MQFSRHKMLVRTVPHVSQCVCVLPLLLLAGCLHHSYFAETIVHSDGTIERSIYGGQAEPLEDDRWQQARKVDENDFLRRQGAIRDIPAADEKKEKHGRIMVTAWGKFDKIDGVPDYYRLDLKDEKGSARFERTHERTDLVFVTEHYWKETLTDTFEITDARNATKELVQLGAQFTVDVLTERFGDDYDFSGLLRWADSEGLSWSHEVLDLLVDAGMHTKASNIKALERYFGKKLTESCATRGLVLRDAEGRSLGDKDLNQDQLWKVIRTFAESKLRELILRRDGQPVEDAVFKEILNEFDDPDDDQVTDEENEPARSPLQQAGERVLMRNYGGEEAFQDRIETLMQHVVGVHTTGAIEDFDYLVQMPGLIVEATGEMQSDNRVRWEFEGADAFPSGYVMSCRSLEADAELQRQLLGGEPLKDRATLLKYKELVVGRELLLAVLRECRKQNSMKLLNGYRQQAVAEERDYEVQQVDRLMELLGMVK